MTRPSRFVSDRIKSPTPEISATGEMLACNTRVRFSRFSASMLFQIPLSQRPRIATRPSPSMLERAARRSLAGEWIR